MGGLSHYTGTYVTEQGTTRTIEKYLNGNKTTITQTNVTKTDGKVTGFTQDGDQYSNITWKQNSANDWDINNIDSGNKLAADGKTYVKEAGRQWTLVNNNDDPTPANPEVITDGNATITIQKDADGKLQSKTIVINNADNTTTTIIQNGFTYTEGTNPVINGFNQKVNDGTTYKYSDIQWKTGEEKFWNLENTTSYKKNLTDEGYSTGNGTSTTETFVNSIRTKKEVSTQSGNQGINITTNYKNNGQIDNQTVTTSGGTTSNTETRTNFIYNGTAVTGFTEEGTSFGENYGYHSQASADFTGGHCARRRIRGSGFGMPAAGPG